MFESANLFYPSPTYLIVSVAIACVVGFTLGYLLRSKVVAQHKKRILNLEEEMLSNHSHILELEKQIADLKNGKLTMKSKQPVTSKAGSKISR